MNFIIGLALFPLGLIIFLFFKRVRICLWLGAMILFSSMVFMSLGLFEVATEQDQLWQESAEWVQTDATVLNSGKKVKTERKKTGSTTHTDKKYSYQIRYSYQVGSGSYENSRYSLSSYNSSKKNVEELIRRYPSGSQIQILYDSENPTESTVIRGKSSPKTFIISLASIPALVAVFIAVGMVRVMRRQMSAKRA